jgi:gliding motility-associated-like protein
MKVLQLLLLLLFSSYGYSQLFVNKGQNIYSGQNTIIKIEGSILNDNSGSFVHNGLIEIDSSLINLNNSVYSGSGTYKVFQDWINSAQFTCNSSTVILTGNNQFITGDSITTFYNLTLSGNGIKRQTIDAKTLGTLNLNNLELATDYNNHIILNASPNAILYDTNFGSEGFVSSLGSGRLIRYTNSISDYNFPLGSSLNTYRFRPVVIHTKTNTNEVYAASFVNNNPLNDNYNPQITDINTCKVNELFYHNIERFSNSFNADVSIKYLPSDGNWNKTSEWINAWSNPVGQNGTSGNFLFIRAQNWPYNSSKIALSRITPIAPEISGDSLICLENGNSITLSSNMNVIWNTNTGTILSGQNSNSANFEIAAGNTAFITAYYNDGFCNSHLDTFKIIVKEKPVADFVLSDTLTQPKKIIQATDLSQANIISWNWDFDNNHVSTIQHPQFYYYNPGEYNVVLIVENSDGCTDTAMASIIIKENEIIIPNVISPNGDGMNDYFKIPFKQYNLTILNRWGQTVYSGNEASTLFDGTAINGETLPDGTYYYIILHPNGEEKGALTLIR